MLNLHFCVAILHLKRNKEQQIFQWFKFGVGAEGEIQLSVTWFYFSFKIWINILRSNQKVWMHAWIIGSVWVAGSYPAVLGTWSPWTVPDVIRISLGPAEGTFKFYLFTFQITVLRKSGSRATCGQSQLKMIAQCLMVLSTLILGICILIFLLSFCTCLMSDGL